ncbi:MAG: AMP-binding protein, partial [Beijerinckiaceae bacterium]
MGATGSKIGPQRVGGRLNGAWAHLTLDHLVETASRARAHRRAYVDAPDRESWDGSPARTLTSEALAREVRLRARQLLALGLSPGDVVLTALPNSTDAIAALLGMQLAGLCPCPLPVVSKADEMRDAAELLGARAIVTVGRYADLRPSDVAAAAAASVFGVRFVCALGDTATSGVVSLSGWEDAVNDLNDLPAIEPDWAALVSIDRSEGATRLFVRNHAQLIADALALSAVAGLSGRNALLATLAPVSAAGVVATLVAPLISSCMALLHGPFNVAVFQDQLKQQTDIVALLPARAEAAIRQLAADQMAGIISVVRDPAFTPGSDAEPRPRVTELISFDEAALLCLPREFSGKRRLPRFTAHPVSSALPRTEAQLALSTGSLGQLRLEGFSLARNACASNA